MINSLLIDFILTSQGHCCVWYTGLDCLQTTARYLASHCCDPVCVWFPTQWVWQQNKANVPAIINPVPLQSQQWTSPFIGPRPALLGGGQFSEIWKEGNVNSDKGIFYSIFSFSLFILGFLRIEQKSLVRVKHQGGQLLDPHSECVRNGRSVLFWEGHIGSLYSENLQPTILIDFWDR